MICMFKVIHYCWLMYLRTSEICLLKYMNLILQISFSSGLAWQAALKKTKVKLDLLTGINVWLLIKKGIRGGICHAIYQYTKAKNKYMKDYDKNKESSCVQYWDVNNLYGWVMLLKLPLNNFEWIKHTFQFNEAFVRNYNEESDEGYFEVDVQYLEKLHEIHNDLAIL